MNQRLLVAAIISAGALIAAAVALRPAGPRYALVYTGFSNGVYRLDTRTGDMMLCQGAACTEVSTVTADQQLRNDFGSAAATKH